MIRMGNAILLAGLAWTILLVVSTGCQRDPKMMRVWGKVTFEGQPINDGQVIFKPIEGTGGPVVAGDIGRGTYQTSPAAGLLPGGTYRVEIVAAPQVRQIMRSSGEPPLAETPVTDLIPAIYSRDSTLRITVSEIPSKNRHDFLLTSQSSP